MAASNMSEWSCINSELPIKLNKIVMSAQNTEAEASSVSGCRQHTRMAIHSRSIYGENYTRLLISAQFDCRRHARMPMHPFSVANQICQHFLQVLKWLQLSLPELNIRLQATCQNSYAFIQCYTQDCARYSTGLKSTAIPGCSYSQRLFL